ncbi:ArsR/SmtB family transcription factor [Frondihabitans australicus]|nr:ArsR family transcriptional regulator [Frondihabitans australicus]
MGHPARRFIIRELAQRESLSREIAEAVQHVFGLGWPAVTRHLKILNAAGFVRVRRVWNERLYRLDDQALDRLEDDVRELGRLWRKRTGGGYHGLYDETDDSWGRPRQPRRPVDAAEAFDRLLRDEGIDPATGKLVRDAPGEGLAETAGV